MELYSFNIFITDLSEESHAINSVQVTYKRVKCGAIVFNPAVVHLSGGEKTEKKEEEKIEEKLFFISAS